MRLAAAWRTPLPANVTFGGQAPPQQMPGDFAAAPWQDYSTMVDINIEVMHTQVQLALTRLRDARFIPRAQKTPEAAAIRGG